MEARRGDVIDKPIDELVWALSLTQPQPQAIICERIINAHFKGNLLAGKR